MILSLAKIKVTGGKMEADLLGYIWEYGVVHLNMISLHYIDMVLIELEYGR